MYTENDTESDTRSNNNYLEYKTHQQCKHPKISKMFETILKTKSKMFKNSPPRNYIIYQISKIHILYILYIVSFCSENRAGGRCHCCYCCYCSGTPRRTTNRENYLLVAYIIDIRSRTDGCRRAQPQLRRCSQQSQNVSCMRPHECATPSFPAGHRQ